MQMQDKVFIDTNIILYAISTKDERKHSVAKPIVLSDATISAQVINEASVNLIKKLNFTEDMVRRFINSSYQRYNIIELTKNVFIYASELREKYNFSYYDSAIVAAALVANCTILYSEDMQDGLVVTDRLKIINPFK
jgi:predicted nucleic acid-binding protein